ncbi:lactonase family protein [Lederbergia lenta]|uniref:6-phosphogluconolactonase n=1 Tax=Lederbergia lenta TaxID=1467 RepID=A0A2X4WF33_LEDLE|nr:lactonase family protein [Lederbergia lenta]MCM3112227.1 lactonase family protein [Lederbergia lenta]MEC2323395.1 lactonase family protein [Lederbergia lenta]SQI63347.1 6-phosphogluconolactonase [Lederbergia lenta]
MGKKYIGYAGTYTRENSEGIYSFTLDVETGKLSDVKVAAKVGSPTYLAISDDQRYLYSVAQEKKLGGVAAYSVDKETGDLTPINKQVQEGAPPCHLDVLPNGVVTGNYHEGTIELLKTTEDGAIANAASVVQHEGNGPHERQEKPHVHYTASTPDGKYVVVADLGIDELVTYQVANGELVKVNTLKVKAGSGPRHITFHPNGKFAYLLTELSSEVVVLAYDSEHGSFTEKQYIRAIPEDFTETNDASAIHISADGKFVYSGNRGHNSIAVFSVNGDSGELTFIEHVPTGGEWPRDFVLDPSEAFIIASNQHSGNLVLFARNQETGKLKKLDAEVAVPEVVCVKFLAKE